MMYLDDLKLTLLNLYCSSGANPFFEFLTVDNGKIMARNRNVYIEGNEKEIIVFFDEN